MEFQDKTLNCVDCGTEFIWTAREQLFLADKNFKNELKRCKSCKAKRASRPSAGASVVAILTAGHRVEVVGKKDVWLKIRWDGETVYIKEGNILPISL